jgi:hypothetical protein
MNTPDRWFLSGCDLKAYLYALKKAGQVVPTLGEAGLATGRGLAWLETHSSLGNEMPAPDEPARPV